MNNVKFEDMLFEVVSLGGLGSVPPEIAIAAIKKATIELCEISNIWKENVTLDIQENVCDYPIDVPENVRLVSVDGIRLNSCNNCSERGTAFFKQCCGNYYRPRRDNGILFSCMGRSFSITKQNTLNISALPNEDVCFGLTLVCYCKPTQDACEMPYELFEDWSDVIASGAKAKLLMMPKQTWTNFGLATTYMKMFQIGKTRAKNKRTTQNMVGQLYMSGGYF